MEANPQIRREHGQIGGGGGIILHHQSWHPGHEPAAAVVIQHGIGNHGDRYADLAERLAADGYAVYALDQRGHGRSPGARAYIERFGDVVEDLRSYIEGIRAPHPGRALFLFGHSWGGLVSLAYTIRFQNELDGLVLCAAGIEPTAASTGQIAAVRQLARNTPQAPVVELKLDKLTRDPTAMAAYNGDPLVYHGKIPAQTAAQTLDAIGEATGELQTITLPVLIMHGTDDQVSAPVGSQRIYEAVGSPDRTFKLYPGLWHQLYNEPERDTVLTDLAAWLRAHSNHDR